MNNEPVVDGIIRNLQFKKFCAYGFLKNLRFFEPFLLLFFMAKGLSYTQIGFLLAFKEIAINILEMPTGVIADITGRKNSMLFSFASYVVSYILFSIAGGFYSLLVAMVFFAAGDAFRTGTHKAMIFDYLNQTGQSQYKKEYYGYTRSVSKAGSALSALIAAGLVIYSRNYSLIFQVSAVMSALGFILILSYPNSLNRKMLDKGNDRESFKNYFKLVFANCCKDNLKLVLSSSFHTGLYKGLKDYVQVIVAGILMGKVIITSFNEDQNKALLMGITYSLFFLAAAYASSNAAKITRKFKSEESMLNFTLLSGGIVLFAAGICAIFDITFLIIVFYIIISFFENVRKPVAVGMLGERTDNKVLAAVLSVLSQAETVITAGFAFTLGVLADLLHSPARAMVIAAGVATFFSLYIMLKEKKTA